MYNTSSNGRGSSSSSSSQKPHYNSSSSDKRYKREDEGRERRYGDCSDRSSSGRRGVDEDVSRRRKSRWDEGGRSNGNDSYTSSEVKKRSRSRSPVKYSSTTSQLDAKSEPIRTNKKNANNWSDSSSDEDNSKVKGTRNDDRRPYNDSGFKDERVSSSLSENNNEEFKGVGLDLGYQYGDHFSSTPPSLGIPGYPHRLEIIDVRSLMSNNNNHYAAALNGSASSPTNTGTKSAGSGIQMKLIQPVVKPTPKTPSIKPKISSVFNVDSDEDEEEMPPECKMRMKNIGRETPTSAGPNSFGKTKMGFCNTIQIKERKLEEQLLKKK